MADRRTDSRRSQLFREGVEMPTAIGHHDVNHTKN
jgi:hypothetical protein